MTIEVVPFVRDPRHSSGAADLSIRSSGAIAPGPADGKDDLGEPVEGLAVSGKAVRHDHDAMGLLVPFANDDSPGGARSVLWPHRV